MKRARIEFSSLVVIYICPNLPANTAAINFIQIHPYLFTKSTSRGEENTTDDIRSSGWWLLMCLRAPQQHNLHFIFTVFSLNRCLFFSHVAASESHRMTDLRFLVACTLVVFHTYRIVSSTTKLHVRSSRYDRSFVCVCHVVSYKVQKMKRTKKKKQKTVR